MEQGHEIDWEKTTCLEKEKRTIPRTFLEGCHIKSNRKICVDLSDSVILSAQYGEGEEAWIWRGKERQEQLNVKKCRTTVQPDRRSR